MLSIFGASLTKKRVALICFLTLIVLAAIYIHISSDLPLEYSWSKTALLFWRSISDEYFIVAAFFSLLSAFSANRLQVQLSKFEFYSDVVPAMFTVVLFAALLLIPSRCNMADLALSIPAAMLFYLATRRRRISRVLAGLIIVTSMLVVVSYAFTIIKSQLFVHAEPLDRLIVASEVALFGRPLYLQIAEWASSNPLAVRLSDWVYYLFFHHMALVALYLYALGDWVEQRKYALSLATCYLIGAVSYHVFPALGPAYYSPSAFGYLRQNASYTVIIQDLLSKSTESAKHGTLQSIETYAFIACMPSLHMAHESVMLFFSRGSVPMLLFSGAFWVASLVSVLVLGWHYLLDVLAGLGLAIISVFFCLRTERRY